MTGLTFRLHLRGHANVRVVDMSATVGDCMARLMRSVGAAQTSVGGRRRERQLRVRSRALCCLVALCMACGSDTGSDVGPAGGFAGSGGGVGGRAGAGGTGASGSGGVAGAGGTAGTGGSAGGGASAGAGGSGGSVGVPMVPTVFGPAGEACTKVGEQIANQSGWEKKIEDGCGSNNTCLLRAGTYILSETLSIPADQTLKPYDCESAIIRGDTAGKFNLTVSGNDATVAGLTLEVSANYAVFRVEHDSATPLTKLTLSNNNIRGGTGEAVRLAGNLNGVTVDGNDIDGGRGGHNLLFRGINGRGPRDTVVRRNRFRKEFFPDPSEDYLQYNEAGGGSHLVEANLFGASKRMEDGMDIKAIESPIMIRYNVFQLDQMSVDGPGEDGNRGNGMIIHECDAAGEKHVLEGNRFLNAPRGILTLSTKPGCHAKVLAKNNIFEHQGNNGGIGLFNTDGSEFFHNTFVGAEIKFGLSDCSLVPKNLAVINNIFSGSKVLDRIKACGGSYTCEHNLSHQVGGGGLAPNCATGAVNADPQFLGAKDYHLKASSLAVNAGKPALGVGIDIEGTPRPSGPAPDLGAFERAP